MKRAVALLMTALLVAACGGDDDDDASSSGSGSKAEASDSASGNTAEATEGDEETTPSSLPDDGEASCTDPADDGGAGELTGVELRIDDDDLVVTWTVATPPTATDAVLYTVFVANYDEAGNGPAFRLVASTDGTGKATDTAIFDMRAAQDNKLGEAPEIDGDTVTARFPLDQIGVGDRFDWQADVNVDGTDTDGCPTLKHDALAPFPE